MKGQIALHECGQYAQISKSGHGVDPFKVNWVSGINNATVMNPKDINRFKGICGKVGYVLLEAEEIKKVKLCTTQ